MKLIEAVNANLAAQEMSQQRLPYDLALAVVKVKRATADETDFFLREERALVEEYADSPVSPVFQMPAYSDYRCGSIPESADLYPAVQRYPLCQWIRWQY